MKTPPTDDESSNNLTQESDEDDIPIVNWITQHDNENLERSSEDHSSDTRNTSNSTDEDDDNIPLTKLKFDMISRGSFD